jgi:RNA 2',3'-cyclic 3'-phosphodiesterase
MRAFISLNISDENKREILEIQNEVKSLLDRGELDSIKWEGRDKFHQTLFFLGDISDGTAKDLISDLDKIKNEINFGEIKFTAKGINAFPKLRYPRVLIVDFDNPDGYAFQLYEKICKKLDAYGFKPDKHFHPHVTLGRVRRDKKINLEFLKEKIKVSLSFSVKNFYLMESKLDSHGSIYRDIKKFNLP